MVKVKVNIDLYIDLYRFVFHYFTAIVRHIASWHKQFFFSAFVLKMCNFFDIYCFVWHESAMLRRCTAINRSRFNSQLFHFHTMTPGKMFTHMHPSPSSIIWYWPNYGWEGNRRSGFALAMHH